MLQGNVLTSQRLTDVILYAFGAAANSQGDMSNLTFGGGKKRKRKKKTNFFVSSKFFQIFSCAKVLEMSRTMKRFVEDLVQDPLGLGKAPFNVT